MVMSPSVIHDETEMLRCRSDFDYYAKKYLVIKDKQSELKPFVLNRAQRTVQKEIGKQLRKDKAVRVIVLKARQEGISTLVAGRFFRRFHLRPFTKAKILADQKDKGKVLFEIYGRFFDFLDEQVKPDKRFTEKGTDLMLHTGSHISVGTAGDPTEVRAETPQLYHLSEMAFWPKAKDVWVSLAGAIPDIGSEVIIESTANGVGDFFHEMWQAAKAGENEFVPIFLPWWIHEEYQRPLTQKLRSHLKKTKDPWEREALDHGIELDGKLHRLTLEQIAWRRRTITRLGDERAFRQEFPSTDREAFLVSGACFFDEETLAKYDDTIRLSPSWKFRGSLEGKRNEVIRTSSDAGPLRIWFNPGDKMPNESKAGSYVIGADTAEGKTVEGAGFSEDRGGRDFSVADVIDVTNRRQVAQLRSRSMAPEVFAEQLYKLGMLYSTNGHPALLAVEKNHSSGETVIRKLQTDYHYPNLYSARQMNKRLNRITPVLGWVTTVATRMPLLDGLAEAIREESIDLRSPETVREMFTFIRYPDGKPAAQEGAHDDCVISCAITLEIATHTSQSSDGPKVPIPEPEVFDSPTGLVDYGW